MTTATPRLDALTRLYRMSVEQYDQLARTGIIKKSDRVELIEGLLVEKRSKNERHIATTWLIQHVFGRELPPGWSAVTESPIVLTRSEPEPDVLVLRGQVSDYFRRKPRPSDVPLVVEVADSSYAADRPNRSFYAEASLATYWIANIRAGRIEVYTDPTGPCENPEYRSRVDRDWDEQEATDVHHRHYRTLYDERPEDLQHLCRPCHRFVSGKDGLDPLAFGGWAEFMRERIRRL